MPIRRPLSAADRLLLLLSALLAVAGCATNPPAPTPNSTITAAPGNTPTQTPNLPPTANPSPTATPSPTLGDTRTRSTDGMVEVYVPAGTFPMGSTEAQVEDGITLCREHYGICNRWYYQREHPQHPVSLAGFWLDRTEVTNAQYHRCVEAGACEAPTRCKKGEPTYDDPEKTDHPVVCANWTGAGAYCAWAGTRLPTEAEWEFASRGQAGRVFPWGDLFDGARLNYCDVNCEAGHADTRYDDGFARSSPAGLFPEGASWTGALGLAGNASEWVADWYGPYTPGAETDPSGPLEGKEKLVKGCSWFFHPTYCRGALRASVDPDTRFDYLGFRCAASPP